MIYPGQAVRIVIATKPVDFRKGHDGLAALAERELGLDPHSGIIVVFRAKLGGARASGGERAAVTTIFTFCDLERVCYEHRMKTGTRVIVTFAESDNLAPSPGKVIEQLLNPDKGLHIKVRHDNGLDNWYLAERVSPLLRPIG